MKEERWLAPWTLNQLNHAKQDFGLLTDGFHWPSDLSRTSPTATKAHVHTSLCKQPSIVGGESSGDGRPAEGI